MLGGLLCMAGATVLGRLAVGSGSADPAGYTVIRVAAATLALVIARPSPRGVAAAGERGSWLGAALLVACSMLSTWALVTLTAATGTLLFFGAAQGTMLAAGLRAGERPDRRQQVGLALAIAGMAAVLAPGVSTPTPAAAVVMVAAGVAWGTYSLRGRRVADAVAVTAGNHLRALPLVAAAAVPLWPQIAVTLEGALLAAVAGAVATSLGSVLWYTAVRRSTASGAATAQLAVPVLAALLGAGLLGEPLTARLVASGAAVLAGIGLAVRPSAPDHRTV
jgi:drug/metabolite transporter (DMT)-like permease